MKTHIFRNTQIYPLLVLFFVFAMIFPSIRLLSIGNETSSNIQSYIFSASPEIFALCLMILSFLSLKNNHDPIKLKPIDWILALFIISNVIIGTIISNDIILSAYSIRLTYFPILFYFLFRFLNIKTLLGSLHIIYLWIFCIALVGIILYFAFFDAMSLMMNIANPVLPEYFIVRMSSILWSPVVFATFMMAALFYFFHRFLADEKWYWLLPFAFVCFCIIMSMSRGPMIISIFGLLLMTILYRKKISLFPWLVLAGVYCFTAFIIASPGELSLWIFESASDTVGLKKGVTRVDLWINAFHNFQEHPFGMGLGKAGHVAARFFSQNTTQADVFSTDGWYLKTLNETGVWGLFSYLFFAAVFFIVIVKQMIHHKQKQLLFFIFSLFISINIQNMVSNVLDFYLFSFLYWGSLGLAANIIFNHNN